MSQNIPEIPFTELVERASQLARERANVEQKVRGIVNDVYVRDIARKEDWNFFLVNSALTLTENFNLGDITVTTGNTTAIFSSVVTVDSSFTGKQLKIDGNDYVYNVTFQSASSCLINPPLSGNQNVTSAPYNLFKSLYSLAPDFDRFPKNGGLINYRGSAEDIIPEKPYQEFTRESNSTPTDTPSFCRIYGTDTAGNQLLEVNPPPKIAKSLRYDYFIRPKIMREITGGTVQIGGGGTTVIGDAASFSYFASAVTGDWLRIDAYGVAADSEWYRVIAVNNNSSLTLQTAFNVSGVTSAAYTLCSAPQMPAKMHPAVLYGTILQLVVDQDDPMTQAYMIKLAEVLSDGKRLYKSRVYNQTIHSDAEDWMYRR